MAAESGEQRAGHMVAKAELFEREAQEKLAQAARLLEQAKRIDKGNEGDRVIGALLNELQTCGWVVLHDRRRKSGSTANIDHLVIGPPGVCVIDAKNWKAASVRFDAHGMKVGGYRKDRELDMTRLVADEVQAAARRVVPGIVSCGVLAFVGDMGLAGPVYEHGVVVLQREQLLPWLRSLPTTLDQQAVRRLGLALKATYAPRLVATPPAVQPVRSATVPGRRHQPVRSAPGSSGGRSSLGQEAKRGLAKVALLLVAIPVVPWALVHLQPLADEAGKELAKSVAKSAAAKPTPTPVVRHRPAAARPTAVPTHHS